MKKAIIILMLLISVTTLIISCKKDDQKSEKEKVTELLVGSKWYYEYAKDAYGNIATGCFNENDHWEFKADGTSNEKFMDIGGDTYTIGEDGKTITLSSGFILSVTLIDQSKFKFLIVGEGETLYEINLSKTAGAGSNCPN